MGEGGFLLIENLTTAAGEEAWRALNYWRKCMACGLTPIPDIRDFARRPSLRVKRASCNSR